MRNFLIWLVVFFIGYGVIDAAMPSNNLQEMSMSQMLEIAEQKKIAAAEISDEKVYIELINNDKSSTTRADEGEREKAMREYNEKRQNTRIVYITPYYAPKIIDTFQKNNIQFKVQKRDDGGTLGRIGNIIGMLLSWLPMLLILAIWLSFRKNMQGGDDKDDSKGKGGGIMGGNPFSFGKSKAKAIAPEKIKTRFCDVAGINEAKEDLEEMVDFLKNPLKYSSIGAKIPKGCLLIGQPGTGKTLLAKAIAGEAGVPFFFISGSDFVEMFVGVGASRVRDLFAQAKKNSPCIIFIDEIDAVGRHRGVGIGGGNDEREQTLNQMLVEMDGFEENSGIIVLAATNRPDVLDPALLRPGRFDRQVTVSLPDVNGRKEILQVHVKNVKIGPDVNFDHIARGTSGFSGAEIANLVNEAALFAASRKQNIVMNIDFEDARDKVLMGKERKSMKIKDQEKKLTAYHEGGHALVGLTLPASDPIHKATIIPRGRALGMVMRLPEDDRLSLTREKMHADLAVAMAGRVAEEIIFGNDKVTSGASSDIKMATNLARAMVTEWGMSEKVGNVNHASGSTDQYSGNKSRYHCSEKIAEIIDEEVKSLVQEGYSKAKEILTNRLDDLHILANALLEYETLSGDEINKVLAKEKIRTQESEEQKSSFISPIRKEFKVSE